MLVSLYVKNLALIEETEVEFTPGLNILTGETGAGKSILLGSVNLALGAKADKDLIRRGADSALVELTFSGENERVREKLKEMELPCEEVVTITRKIQPARSISRINGETVNVKQLKEIAELLLDVHGQHEHQSLLHKKKHLEILDAYVGEELYPLLSSVKRLYQEKNRILAEIEAQDMDDAGRNREAELLNFELQEIEQAQVRPGEDEELESRYRRMVNSKKIGEALGNCYRYTEGDGEGAASFIGRAVRELNSAAVYDEGLEGLSSQISEIESLLSDFNRELSDYMDDMEFDGADFAAVEERLNLLNHLKDKYGKTLEEVLVYKESLLQKIEKLENYELYMQKLQKELLAVEGELQTVCEQVSKKRSIQAKGLEQTLKQALEELNFLTVEFVVKMQKKEVSADGYDDVEFMISTNPGEEVKPLGMVASGGELSRIMLGIKTVLADKDAVDTLIFDEIDAGISGRTAWKVSEKLGQLGQAHQVICITHLPQIAAMADTHFVIEKQTDGNSTVTGIRSLDELGVKEELARLLGADSLSEAALSNAEEIKMQAAKFKQ
ncbi:MAG: DNA repair protein RecN [Lachnospiraceae bacterium]|nr:DNA repair protein RecN [Lachnospiraceae bacterium]